MKPAAAVLCALLTTALVAGCSGDPQDPSPAAPSPTPAATAATAGVISPADLAEEPTFSNKAQGAIDDVRVTRCDTEPGRVVATGTATNSGDFARDVAVVMSWTVGSVGDVVARQVAEVTDLEPGETGNWTIRTTLPGSTTAACVPSALAGQLEG